MNINKNNSNKISKSFPQKWLVVSLFLFLVFQIPAKSGFSASISSRQTGNWSTASTWVGDQVPDVNDDVTVNGTNKDTFTVTILAGTTVEVNSLNIGSTGKLIVYGTLIIHGNLTMVNNGSELVTSSGASIFIYGSAVLDNKVTISLSSFFIVLGDFTKSGASNQGSITIDDAHIYVMGNVNSSWENFTACTSEAYLGTTSSVTDNCDAGSFDDFLNNIDPDDLPGEIFEQIISSVTYDVSTLEASNLSVCSGENVALLINDSNSPLTNIAWYRDNLKIIDNSTVISIDTISVPGDYYAVYQFGSNWYRTNTIGISVSLAPLLQATGTNALTCGTNGTISFTLINVPDGIYTIQYDGGSFSGVSVSEGLATVSASAGNYQNLIITVNGCTSVEDVDIVLTGGDAPNISDLQAAVTTVGGLCPDQAASISVTSSTLADGSYTVAYQLSGPNELATGTASMDFASGTGTFATVFLVHSGETVLTIIEVETSGCSAPASLNVSIPVNPSIDVEVVDLGDGCQSGETGSKTLVTWEIIQIEGKNNWTFDYTISDGTTTVKSGANVEVTGNSTQVSFEMDNETAVSKTFTLTVFNVADDCGPETETGNNTGGATLFGVPATSDIISN